MTIQFNITDEFGTKFLDAVKWKLDRPDLTDEKIQNKYLKQCIGCLVDEHAREVAIGIEERKMVEMRNQFIAAENELREKQLMFETSKVVTDIGLDE